MPACKILTGFSVNCDTTLSPGTKDNAILISREDIIGMSYDVVNFPDGNVITNLTRATGTKGVAIQGQNNSHIARDKFARGAFFGKYTHEFDFIAFDVTPEATASLERLNKDRVVAVYEDNNRRFRIKGLNAGLRTQTNDGSTEDQDTGGGHRITMSSGDEAGYAEYLAVYTGTGANKVYDYTATKAVFNALLNVAI